MASNPSVFQEYQVKGRNVVTFRLTPTDVSYANTLRRLILTGVKSVGFNSDMDVNGKTTDVAIYRNNTPMTNEMLADRIGLLPITFPNPEQWDPSKFIFELNVENLTNDPKDVTASDIQVFQIGENGEKTAIEGGNTRFFPADPVSNTTALLAALKPKRGTTVEGIHFEAIAKAEFGRKHARYNPVSQCSYRYTRDTNEGRIDALFNEWLTRAKKIADPKSLDDSKKSVLRKEYQTMEIDRCYVVDEKTNEPNSFDFVLEGMGTMAINDIVKQALINGVTMVQKYTDLEKSSLPEDLRVQPAANRLEGFDFFFRGHDHTLGNLLQTYIEKHMMTGTKVTYVGYAVPHPLRDEMLLRVGIAGGLEIDAYRVVAEACRGCAALFAGWLEDWNKTTGAPTVVRGQPVRVRVPKQKKVG